MHLQKFEVFLKETDHKTPNTRRLYLKVLNKLATEHPRNTVSKLSSKQGQRLYCYGKEGNFRQALPDDR